MKPNSKGIGAFPSEDSFDCADVARGPKYRIRSRARSRDHRGEDWTDLLSGLLFDDGFHRFAPGSCSGCGPG
jgi:hypothetical protein